MAFLQLTCGNPYGATPKPAYLTYTEIKIREHTLGYRRLNDL